jgi:hypothetical protein
MNIDNYFSKFAIERLNFFAGYAAKKWDDDDEELENEAVARRTSTIIFPSSPLSA